MLVATSKLTRYLAILVHGCHELVQNYSYRNIKRTAKKKLAIKVKLVKVIGRWLIIKNISPREKQKDIIKDKSMPSRSMQPVDLTWT